MANRLHVGTRKGLFELARTNGEWEVVDVQFLGDPVSAVLADADSAVYAALDLGHFGAKLWRRDRSGAWSEIAAPVFPPKPDDNGDDPHPWSLGKVWVLEPGGVAGRLWAGTMPGGLFRSDDGGTSWSLNEALWHMPERRRWAGVAGGEQPGINSVLIDPRNASDIRVGVSTAGVWASTDGGASWRLINRGMYAEYHNGVFRSEDAGATWREVTAIRPSKFGFAVAAHPRDANTAWFVPAIKAPCACGRFERRAARLRLDQRRAVDLGGRRRLLEDA